MNLNKTLFIGNVTGNPELVYTPKGTPVVNAALASNEFYTGEDGERQQVTTYADIKVWGPSAEHFANLVKKGQEIFVEGSLRQDTWEDKQTGQKRSKLYLRVDSWQFTQRKANTQAEPPVTKETASKTTKTKKSK
jgi:single-strand DNA-binding protein